MPEPTTYDNNKWGWLALAMLVTLAFPGPAAHAVVLKIATLSPDGTLWMNKMREGANEITQRTDGRVRFKFYPGGVMGNDQSVLRKIRIGQLQGGAVMSGALSHAYPDSQIYSLPFLFHSLDEVDYVRLSMDETLKTELEDHGFVTFGFAEAGFAYIMSASPLRSVEDVKRQKVWIPSGEVISETILEAAGISPIPLPLADVLTGLQTGLIDTVATSPLGAIALQWHTRVTYVSDVPVSYLYGVLAIDRRAFNRLRPADQEVVREVMTQIYGDIDRQNRLDNAKARDALLRQGVTFVEVPPVMLSEWKDIAATATELLREKGAFTSEALHQLQEHLSEYRASRDDSQ